MRLARAVTSVAFTAALVSCNAEDPKAGDDDAQVEDSEVEEPRDPGTVTLHRLNRSEYDRTVRDLLGTLQTPARDFPADDTQHGFDNQADVLTVSPLLFEMVEQAASSLVKEALDQPPQEPILIALADDDLVVPDGRGLTLDAGGWLIWSSATATADITVPTTDTYQVTVEAWASQAGPDLAQLHVSIDGISGGTEAVVAESRATADVFHFDVEIPSGLHTLGVGFLNDYYDPELGEDRNLYVAAVSVEGPIDFVAEINPIRARLMVCEPDADDPLPCIREVLAAFVPRAWRRPVANDELDGLVGLAALAVDNDDPWAWGLEFALRSVLTSPHFLYRVELDETDGPHPVTDWELASRLSYFLWSTMPDEELFSLAAAGSLNDPAVLGEQVARMLKDDRASSLASDFAGQWLYIRSVANTAPDPWYFPDFDNILRESMAEEMERFFYSFVYEPRDMRELLTAERSWVDSHLAEHYGIEQRYSGFWSTNAKAVGRGGILGMSGLLTALSYPTRTSPTNRGKWILGQLLCYEPPPPPPGVEALPVDDDTEALTLRDRLEQHRSDPTCAACHDLMDPMGFGLENFDGIGAWRDTENGAPVDATGVLDNGSSFEGLSDLNQLLIADPRFSACIAEKTWSWALGRPSTELDEPYLDDVVAGFVGAGMSFEALATSIATSEPFRLRGGAP